MKRSTLTAWLSLIIIVLVVAIGLVVAKNEGWLGNSGIIKDSGSGISNYSAVFLTNGQVYFGEMYARTAQYVDLRDIYYLQVNQQVQASATSAAASPTPSPQVSLVKLGNELHGPNDRMIINESQILFTESLKSSSKVVQAINNYKP